MQFVYFSILDSFSTCLSFFHFIYFAISTET